jgi:hypothetical protein
MGVVVGQSKVAEEQDADGKSQGEKWKTGGANQGATPIKHPKDLCQIGKVFHFCYFEHD